MNTSELIYDWNKNHPPGLKPLGPVLLNDETLRDGLQSPSVRDPSIAEKIEILHLMEALGINSLDLGLPGAGARAVEHVTALAREIVAHKMKIRANLLHGRMRTIFVPLLRSCRRRVCASRPLRLLDRVRSGGLRKVGPTIFFCKPPRRL